MLTKDSIFPDTCLQCLRLQEIFFKALSFSSFIFFLLWLLSLTNWMERCVYKLKQLKRKQLYNSMECFMLANVTAVVLFFFIFRILTCQLIFTPSLVALMKT